MGAGPVPPLAGEGLCLMPTRASVGPRSCSVSQRSAPLPSTVRRPAAAGLCPTATAGFTTWGREEAGRK